MASENLGKAVVIGTIGKDAHILGGWVLSHVFRESGFNVTFLGAMVSQEEFIGAAVETDADAILISSSYGMGLIDCEGMREKCVEAGLDDVILYVGGTIAAPLELERNWGEVERRFQAMGFNRAFKNTCTAAECVNYLKADLKII